MRRTKGFAKNDYEIIRKEIREIFEESYKSYGYRRITAELNARGYAVNHKLVYRLMREENIKCEQRVSRETETTGHFETYSKTWGKKGKDLLARNFKTDAFGQVWVTDMSAIMAGDILIYLTVVIDLYNTEVVGYSISDKPKLPTVLEAIRFAHYQYDSVRPILHSDRGWFYCSDIYINNLKEYGYTQSMAENGSCYDNAVAESFFAQIKTELIYPNEWEDEKTLKREIHKYIKYYNTKRIKKSLGYRSPEQYREGLP